MAENHRHSAASSSSVNSYVVEEPALSAADRTPLMVSGNGTTFACFNTLSPRAVLDCISAARLPRTRPPRADICSSPPLPFLANRKGERLPTTCRFETDTAHGPNSLAKYYP